jgi:hypothetical protein
MANTWVFVLALALLAAGCTSGATQRAEVFGAEGTAKVAFPHPDSIRGFDWQVGDVCTYQVQYGSRKSVHTQTVSDVSAGRITFADKGNDGSGGYIVLEQNGARLRNWISQANGQQLAFDPALAWLSLPLRPANTWAVQTAMIGETFQADTTATFRVGDWEKVRVPAGEFVSLKVTATLSYILINNQGQRNTGTGTWVYWVATGTNCLVKHEYGDSFGDKSSRQLLSFKATTPATPR